VIQASQRNTQSSRTGKKICCFPVRSFGYAEGSAAAGWWVGALGHGAARAWVDDDDDGLQGAA
jgi:hypothetical protein